MSLRISKEELEEIDKICKSEGISRTDLLIQKTKIIEDQVNILGVYTIRCEGCNARLNIPGNTGNFICTKCGKYQFSPKLKENIERKKSQGN